MNRWVVLAILITANTAWAKPLALVWNGPGVCPVGCATSAAKVARMAGYTTRYINPKNMGDAPLAEAKLWVQPGGKSVTAAAAMGSDFLQKIRDFVAGGGQYVGFCAGMFITTEQIGTSGKTGFGIVPGKTELWDKKDPPGHFIHIQLGDRIRKVYYAGGPMLHLSENEAAASGAQVLARYSNGDIASITVPYGAGRVSVSGFHPESGPLWGITHFSFDTDGSDRSFAVKMIKLTEH